MDPAIDDDSHRSKSISNPTWDAEACWIWEAMNLKSQEEDECWSIQGFLRSIQESSWISFFPQRLYSMAMIRGTRAYEKTYCRELACNKQ
jgi:hypothetical protein